MDRKQPRGEPGLSAEELAAEQSQDLPEREAMSVLHFMGPDVGNIAMPINEALAENYNTTQSIASASAQQFVIADQNTDVTDPNIGGFPND